IAPILPFTCDELWRYLPARTEPSVHIALFPKASELDAMIDRDLLDRWATLLAVRDQVVAEIEPLRTRKEIGSSLEARVEVAAPQPELELLKRYARDLPMLFIVSEVELRPAESDNVRRVTIGRATGVKCQRCWRYVPSISTDPASEGLCDRCQDALA